MATQEFHRPLNYPGPCNFSVLRLYCIIHLQETIVFVKRDRDLKIDWKSCFCLNGLTTMQDSLPSFHLRMGALSMKGVQSLAASKYNGLFNGS